MPQHVHHHSLSPSRPVVVIDNGSGMIKVGFSCSDSPRAIFPTIVGHKKESSDQKKETTNNDLNSIGSSFVGEMAIAHRELLDIKSPMENGIISNFDDMEKICYHLYPEFLSQNQVRIQSQSVMGLCSSARSDGVVLDAGYTKSYAVPILEGIALPHAIQRRFELSDGSKVNFGEELMSCPEALFNPQLIKEGEGIHKILVNSIFNSNAEITRQLFANIVLVGVFPIIELAPLSVKVKILSFPERKLFLVWRFNYELSFRIPQYGHSQKGI
ncbi:hypothetical protein NAEGRDRAFT_60993 [Naegleria gruberi]|uniref:Actin n=1 Tax=Naegleria gruberi TaxID=5762 RepID=D2W1A4_NAEGR|nr:uncharacterized protein NAEGRDRAFT_60993 [Naegleria gruberi]EFC37149.1 hypothetical protein NAEGRDRAFT_60993 [Naegleria gruberi]|eukprot:XP_002669893.1 hypothetical protein NAEGRDRAFT_60993 [Naegleria gruberi strain NEG-M]